MSDTYTEIYYHFIWATKKREAMIVPEMELSLYKSIHASCHDLHITIHALNAMPDHIHLACTLPTTVTLADAMQKIKGSSAHLINHLPKGRHPLAWQPGYGVLTFAQRDLGRVMRYIQNQQRHHQSGKLSEKMEQLGTAFLPKSPFQEPGTGSAGLKVHKVTP